MEFSLFTATGCQRCKIVKQYIKENSIDYNEFDFKADGKDVFNAFYRSNRSKIFRGQEGVEFPLLFDGERVIQGVGCIIAFLKNVKLLEAHVTQSDLSHGWVSGLNVSAGENEVGNDFVAVVSFLKTNGLLTQIDTDGRNSELLEDLVEKSLVDRLIFYINGPVDLYEQIIGAPVKKSDFSHSLSLMDRCNEYQIILPIQPFYREGNKKDIITPDEAGQAAAFAAQITGKKTHPFYIKNCIPAEEKEIFESPNLFKYRTACRRYMVKSEIYKDVQPLIE